MKLCTLNELPDGESRGFDPLDEGQDSVLLVRQGTQVYAYRDQCPHYGDTPMAWRRHAYLNAAGTHIVCAAHGALFEIANGACVQGPCMGDKLTALPITITPQGDIYINPGDLDE
ncbi:Rieske 2Fe-2S domain-containing protein [Duganella sp. FT80W]|uniref:Rieske 2Fe-2S domain-containing protein n=1 Tax=Duganella guangzhouensis TaxID=2666084 RepID=A0A6I2KV43_9BURK|nr:Rieske (2Fe-2S) protein [Duganella guangzhouensis]MRW89788.1 Rieske 2Fe-2S domain-containing protein [Duganella guangzhouensis]